GWGSSFGGGGSGGGGGSAIPVEFKAGAGVKIPAGISGMGRTVSVSPKNSIGVVSSVKAPGSAAATTPVYVPLAGPAHGSAYSAAAEPPHSASAAAAAAAKRLGSPPTGSKKQGGHGGEGEKTASPKPNFDGYDFNTIRRVGSIGLPQLSKSRSSGSAVGSSGQP
ncbi:unnamed protein product, partial [Laminaria digitata]